MLKLNKLICLLIFLPFCDAIGDERVDYYVEKFSKGNNLKCSTVVPEKSYTNETYNLTCKKLGDNKIRNYILKITDKNEKNPFKISFSQEYNNLKLLTDNGFSTSKIIDGNEELQILEFIKHNKKFEDEDLKDDHNLVRVLKEIKNLHDSKIKFSNNVNIFSRLDDFLSLLIDSGVDVSHLSKARIKIKKYNKIISSKLKLVPLHGDLVASNILINNDELSFIDFEYSGMFDPIWDLSFLSVNSNFMEDDDIKMLNLYDADNLNNNLEKLNIFRNIVNIWKFCWFKNKVLYSKKKENKALYNKLSQKYLEVFLQDKL